MANPVRVRTSTGWQDVAQGAIGAPGIQGPPGDENLIGAPIPWIADVIPAGYREFDGSPIVQATHPQLYALYGATLPDLRGKMFIGASGTFPLRSAGGAKDHALATTEMPYHEHGVGVANQTGTVSVDHVHWVNNAGLHAHGPASSSGFNYARHAGTGALGSGGTVRNLMGGPQEYIANDGDHNHGWTGGISANHTHTIGGQGGGAVHNNMPPYYAVRWITYAA